jgi:hypothetical protein
MADANFNIRFEGRLGEVVMKSKVEGPLRLFGVWRLLMS